MSLFLITLLNGLFLLALGAVFLWNGPGVEKTARALPRSKPATWILMGAGTAWFLYHVTNFGEADYGNFKQYLFIAFFAIAALSFFWTPDFLAVRGLSILMLLVANENLDAAFMRWEDPQRLVFVAYTYVMIVLAMYLAISPFRVRDFLEWAYAKAGRIKATGAGLLALGLALAAIALTYQA